MVELVSVSVARAAWSFLLSQRSEKVEVSVGRGFHGSFELDGKVLLPGTALCKNKCQFYRYTPGLGWMR